MNLIKYEQACRALADAKSTDEVKEFLAGADAARAYAKQAKNRQLEIDAIEIRTRAERRLGEMILSLQEQGHCLSGGIGRDDLISLKDLGIDSALSQTAQRLALVKADRFDSEVTGWRAEFQEKSVGRIVFPLQYVRSPSATAGRERRIARQVVPSPKDRFANFVSPEGRRIPDWRVGELGRLEGLFDRAARCARTLRENLPVANADALATVESVYRESELAALLESCWSSVPNSNAGNRDRAIAAARKRRTRVCEECSKTFVMKRLKGRAGRFCSRECAFEYQKRGGKVGLRELRCVDEDQSPAR